MKKLGSITLILAEFMKKQVKERTKITALSFGDSCLTF
jgi:hypothetical protein